MILVLRIATLDSAVGRVSSAITSGTSINIYILCATGAVAGWLFARIVATPERSAQIENILVGMFGAVIGGEFVAEQLHVRSASAEFNLGSFALALAGAIALLALLGWMRKIVGPMQQSQSRQKK